MRSSSYRLLGSFRLMLAALVLFGHCAFFFPGIQVNTWQAGNIGVFAFFVLSGFVIAEAMESFYAGRPQAFLVNRLLKIMPAYWVALGLTLIVWTVTDHPNLQHVSPRNLLGGLLLYGTVLRLSDTMIVSIAWTVLIEMHFYIAAAIIFGLIRWTGWRGPILVAAVAICVGGYLYIAATGSYTRWFSPLSFSPLFLLGFGLFHLLRPGASRLAPALMVMISAPLSLHGFAVYVGRTPGNHAAAIALFVLAVGVMVMLSRVRAPAFEPLDKHLGNLTYALYLTHELFRDIALRVFTGGLVPPLPSIATALAALLLVAVVSLLVAAATHWSVERPLIHLRNRFRGVKLYN